VERGHEAERGHEPRGGAATACAGPVIADINTDKARYAPDGRVTIYVDLSNTTHSAITGGTVTLYCKYLGALVDSPPAQSLNLAPGASRTLMFTWAPPGQDFRGYSVEAWVRDPAGTILDNLNTAVDVSSNWTRFPRYGYLSGYPSQPDVTSTNTVWQLKNYHISALQFYDWQHKHHRPLAGTVASPAASWTNLANRPIDRRAVLDLIHAAHGYGMTAMNYNLLNGAWSGYDRDGVDPRWGLWRARDGTDQYRLPMPAGWASDNIYLFHPADAGWQDYLYAREAEVFAAYPFDGWHVDSTGNPPTPVYTHAGAPVDLWTTFRPFLNNARARLTYFDLKTLIDQCIAWSGGKGVVLPAYMNYEHATRFSADRPGTFNASSVLLTDAVIFASGATHLELGDGAHMLCNEYFPNRNLVPGPKLGTALRRYYDFLVAYQNLLQGRFQNSSNRLWLSVPNSFDARPDTVWAFTKISDDGAQHMINLINIRGVRSNAWRDDNADYPTPVRQSDIIVKYYFGAGTVATAGWASPDFQNGKMNDLPNTLGIDDGGRYVQFTVPSLAYWDMIYIRK
jgi:dextranase